MTMRGLVTVVATACAGLLVQGCGDAPESGDGQVFNSDGVENDLGEASSPIRLGVEGGGSGAVELGVGCTGVMIGTRMILTAAHCFDAILGNALQGWVSTTVNYAVTGTTWRCMTGAPTNGKCTVNRSVWVKRGSGANGDRPEQDYAAVFSTNFGGAWANVVAADAADGFYDGPLNVAMPYVFYGRGFFHYNGTGAGVMRYMTDSIDGVSADHFVTNATGTRICRGDSGGPYFQSGSGHWAFGIQSQAVLPTECAEVGNSVWASRLTRLKTGAIDQWRRTVFVPSCTQHSAAFPNHFVCP